jgi:hypothetical protein
MPLERKEMMAIIVDECARAAIARRRAHGHDATLFLRREAYPVRGGIVLEVGWAPRRWPRRALVVEQVGDVAVVVDRRVARYTQWRDLTISARRLGPFENLVVVDELRVLLEMQAWEQMHPAVGHSPAA